MAVAGISWGVAISLLEHQIADQEYVFHFSLRLLTREGFYAFFMKDTQGFVCFRVVSFFQQPMDDFPRVFPVLYSPPVIHLVFDGIYVIFALVAVHLSELYTSRGAPNARRRSWVSSNFPSSALSISQSLSSISFPSYPFMAWAKSFARAIFC